MRGYFRSEFTDSWSRYLPTVESGTTGTSGTLGLDTTLDVPDVPDVPLPPADKPNGAPVSDPHGWIGLEEYAAEQRMAAAVKQ